MNNNTSELCFGLVLLLEAAEYHEKHVVTLPFNKKRIALSAFSPPSCPKKPSYLKAPVSYSLPPQKRIKKLSRGDASGGIWLGANPRSRDPLSVLSFSPIKKSKKLVKCVGGSAHRMWEPADEYSINASSARRYYSSDTAKIPEQQCTKAAIENTKTFSLYHKDDDKHINAVHNIVRRDIWEGFVVNTSKDAESECSGGTTKNARQTGRLARYEGTIGFRCRFCKSTPLAQRAERPAVYPRSLERIYLANIRFQRDHVE